MEAQGLVDVEHDRDHPVHWLIAGIGVAIGCAIGPGEAWLSAGAGRRPLAPVEGLAVCRVRGCHQGGPLSIAIAAI